MIAEFSAGKIVNDSFKLYLRHFLALFVITFICCLPVLAFTIHDSLKPDGGLAADVPPERWELIGNILATLFVMPLSTGALTHAVYQSLRGRPVGVGESLAAGFSRFAPLLGVAVCTMLFVFAGLLLLAIPGIMLACLLYVASPVCVVEKAGVFASMRRSRQLTSGRKWQVFVVLVGINLLLVLFGVVVRLGLIQSMSPATTGLSPGALVFAAFQVFFQTVSTGWNATAAALSYYHLRSIHESVDIEDIANVFD